MYKPLLYRSVTLGIFIINLSFFLFGAALITLGIFAIIDHGNISELSGSTLYASGVYMLIFFGLIIVILAIFGFIAAEKENRCMLITFAVVLLITILFLFISGILVLVFGSSMNEAAKVIMRSSLKNQFGRYRIVTDAWNMTQTRLRCCGVDNLDWSAYNDSWWDKFVNRDIYEQDAKLSRTSPFYKVVPESCCATIIDGVTGWPTNKFRDRSRCQTWQYGPPSFPFGPHNDAIYYAGCFEGLRDYIGQYGNAMGVLAFISFILLVINLVLTIILLLRSRDKKRSRIPDRSHSYGNLPQ